MESSEMPVLYTGHKVPKRLTIQKCGFLVAPKYQPLLLGFSAQCTCFCQSNRP